MAGYAGPHAPTVPQSFTVEFHGYDILVAAMQTLQPGGLTIAGEDLGALEDATHVLFSGSSAGGGGVRATADRLRFQLRQSNPELAFRVALDSAVKPIEAWVTDLVFPGGIPPVDDVFVDMADYEAQKYARAQIWDATADTSCLSAHAADPEACANPDHVLYNHVATPFFVRQDLDEKIPSGADPQLWAEQTHVHLIELADVPTAAEEAADISVVPGVFAPRVGTHTALDSGRFFNETVSGLSFHDVLWNWMNSLPKQRRARGPLRVFVSVASPPGGEAPETKAVRHERTFSRTSTLSGDASVNDLLVRRHPMSSGAGEASRSIN